MNDKKINKVNEIITTINIAYCILLILLLGFSILKEMFGAEAGAASGWFLIIVPVIIVMIILSCVPDFLISLFSLLNNKKPKTFKVVLVIVFSIIGLLVMNSSLLRELVPQIFIIIYSIFKVIILLLNIFILITSNKNNNTN